MSAVAAAVARAAGNVTLVGHAELPAIPDRYPGEGPLGGILTALHHTSADWNLIVACDMPEVSAAFLAELLARAMRSRADVLLPCGPDGLPQPLCAVYHRRALACLGRPFRPRRAQGDGGPRRSRSGAVGCGGTLAFSKR